MKCNAGSNHRLAQDVKHEFPLGQITIKNTFDSNVRRYRYDM